MTEARIVKHWILGTQGASFTTPPQQVKVSGPGTKTGTWDPLPCPTGPATAWIDVYIPSYAESPRHAFTLNGCPGRFVSAERISGNPAGHLDEWRQPKDTYRVTFVLDASADGTGSATATVTWD